MTDQPGFTAARVYVVEEMGNETILVLASGEKQITARAPAGLRLDFDTPVWYRANPAKLHRFNRATGARMDSV
jgi:ABC-type sugar transport system ATPase subunit